MSPALPLTRTSAATRTSAPVLEAGVTVLHLMLPVLAGLGLAAAFAAGRSEPLHHAGLAALIGGMAFAYLHDRIAPGRQAHEQDKNLQRRTTLRQLGLLPALTAALAAGIALTGVAADPARLLAPMALLSLVALAYPQLARLPLGKTVAVSGCWTLAVTLLPQKDSGLLSFSSVDWAGALSIGLLVASGALLCDLKDAGGDRDVGTWNPADAWGVRVTCGLAALSAGAGALLIAAGAPWTLAPPALALLALCTRPDIVARELTGPLVVDASLASAGLAVVLSHALS